LTTATEPSSLDYALPDTRSDKDFLGISPQAWGRALVITGLFAAVFWPNLRRLWLKTNPFTGEANWGHACVVPIIGLYYLFVHREELVKAHAHQFIWGTWLRPSRTVAGCIMLVIGASLFLLLGGHPGLLFSMARALGAAVGVLGALVLLLDWSLATTLFGLATFVYGIYPGQNDYLKDIGMVITLFGIVLLMCGPAVMKIAWFPIVFLVCAIPWPGLVYSWVAEPLQSMAAWVAVHVLNLTGVDSVVSGTKIIIFNANMAPPRVLNVAEACAGMRSLMTFISVGGAIAFLSSRPMWQKIFIVVSTVPIAIFCNVMRISGQGLLDHYVSPKWSESFAHQFVGMMMLLPAFFLILGVGYALDMMFIEEAEEGDADYKVMPKSVVAIETREEAIPALGRIAGVGAPTTMKAVTVLPAGPAKVVQPQVTASPASVVVKQTPTAPAPSAPVKQVAVQKNPVSPAPIRQPAPVAPVSAQPRVAPARVPMTNQQRPAQQMVAPKPVTPKPVVPVNAMPSRPATAVVNGASPQPARMPPPPATSVLRKNGDPAKPAARPPSPGPTDSRRLPPAQPNAVKPKDSK
jgi:exosortase